VVQPGDASPSLLPAPDRPALPECHSGGFGHVRHKETGEVIFFPVTCGTWGCFGCSQRKLGRLFAQALAGEPTKRAMFSTLPDPTRSRIEAIRWVRKKFALLTKRIRRQWTPFEYFAVPEFTKQGAIHLHLLLRCPFIVQDWLSRQWEQLTGAKVVWIKPILKTHSAALHAVKYCLKTAVEISQGTPGFRAVTMSQGYLPDDWHSKDAADSDYEFLGFCSLPGPAFFDLLERFGFEAVPASSNKRGLTLRSRGPPNRDALQQALAFGSSGARQLAATILVAVLSPSAPGVSAEQLRDEIDFLADTRTQF
ncbi:unnamed protein product, partial [marine sediment metagenome]